MPMSGPGNGLSSSYGSPSLDTAMDAEHFVSAPMRPGLTMASPSLWGKTTKRKHEADRYEPYSASLHKRRAVSPTTIASAGTGSGAGHSIAAAAAVTAAAWQRQRARSSTPTTTAQSPLLQAISQQQSPLLTIQTNNTMGYFNNLPMPTPLSIPSPTLSVTRAMSGTMNGVGGYLGANAQSLSKSLPLGVSNNAARMNVTNSNGSTINASESPSSTRPSTPTNIPLPATRAGTTTNGGGSGPGYGSGALGLSLGSGTSKKFKQEQEEQEEQEDMLDDVNAIRLGEK